MTIPPLSYSDVPEWQNGLPAASFSRGEERMRNLPTSNGIGWISLDALYLSAKAIWSTNDTYSRKTGGGKVS
jgi:hypothetical protein